MKSFSSLFRYSLFQQKIYLEIFQIKSLQLILNFMG
jgi:hypothetical protein